MSFDAGTLLRLLPAIYSTRDAQLADALRRTLSPAEAAELIDLEQQAVLTTAETHRREELRQKAAQCVLAPAEVVELAALEALASPTLEQQLRTAELTEKASRGPLKALLSAFAGEIAVLEENLDQLYDDLFIETCADWVIPYIGDLLGSEALHGKGDERGLARAEVAHTIALRRRKGTAAVLEQLARDLTGWNARAVEFFQLLATTQYMNHIRKNNLATPSMRNGDALQWVGTAFDGLAHTLDVRRIASRRGRYNIPNVGIFLWRVDAHRLRRSPAVPEPPGDPASARLRFSPLGNDTALYTRPESEDEITHLAEPINVPVPISRRVLDRDLSTHQDDEASLYYGAGKSIQVFEGDAPVAVDRVVMCNLSDDGAGWAHDAPAEKIAIDPALGRLAVGAGFNPSGPISVTYHYGAFGNLGGGEHLSKLTVDRPGSVLQVPGDHSTIQAALDALGGEGVVEITTSGRFTEELKIEPDADAAIELRAAPGTRPTIEPIGTMKLVGKEGSSIVLTGLLITGNRLSVPATANGLRSLRIAHCTLVPGIALTPDGAPVQPNAASLLVALPQVGVEIERSIVGTLRVDPGSSTRIVDSIVDACSPDKPAYCAPGGGAPEPGGELSCEASTFIGTTTCRLLEGSNSILLGRVVVTRRQEGCVRFSYLPGNSSAPRRFQCQPSAGDGAVNHPRFSSLRYGAPAYCQLTERTPAPIRSGADDESEMGAFHYLHQPQLESNLASRLDEYLRAGLQAGIFYES